MTPRGSVVGVLGGTFDPVHLGHLGAARAVRETFGLERVVLVPCATPPHKNPSDVAPARHRLRMLELAAAGDPGLAVSSLEIERGGRSYTIDTLRALRDGDPAVTPVFILGADGLVDLESWREPRALVREFDLVVVARPGHPLDAARATLAPDLEARLVDVPPDGWIGLRETEAAVGTGGRVFVLSIPPVPVSSSEVRDRARRGLALAGLVPPEVDRYIHAQRLYREEAAR